MIGNTGKGFLSWRSNLSLFFFFTVPWIKAFPQISLFSYSITRNSLTWHSQQFMLRCDRKTPSSVRRVRIEFVFRFFPLQLLLLYISLWYKALSSNGDDLELSHLSHPRCLLEGEFCVKGEARGTERQACLIRSPTECICLTSTLFVSRFCVPTPSLHLISSCLFLLSRSISLLLFSPAHTPCPFHRWLSPALALFSPSDGGHKSLCCQRQSLLDYAMPLFNSFRAWREDRCETTIHPAHFPTSASPK